MRHLKKDRCGYSGYQCNKKDIQVSSSFSIVYDPTPYDYLQVTKRPNHHNFLNLPKSAQGVISSTPYINLQGISASAVVVTQTCVDSYDPFTTNGFFHWFEPVSKVQDFIKYNADYWDSLRDYSSSSQQVPGILMPKAQLSPFNPISAVAINTGALASGNAAKSIGYNKSVKSGCSAGFTITARRIRTNQVGISVDGGQAFVGVDATGELLKVPVARLSQQKVIKGKVETGAIQVYLILTPKNNKFTEFNRKYVFVFEGANPNKPDQRTKLSSVQPNQRWALLGTVQLNGMQTDVIQGTCSPVDMSEDIPPDADDGKIYVHIYNTNTKKKQWIPVKDC